MNRTDSLKRAYTAPWCEAFQTDTEHSLLAGSPAAQPGGGGGGGISVIGAGDDNDDTEISGAKQSEWGNLWED